MDRLKHLLLLILSFAVPAIIAGLGTQAAYWAGLLPEEYPGVQISRIAGVLAGTVIYAKIGFVRESKSADVWLIYLPIVFGSMLSAEFLISNVSGNR